MKTCTSINCFFDGEYRVPVAQQIQRLVDAGFRHLDMNFWDWCHDPRSPFVQDGWEAWVAGIAETAARLGVVFTQSHAHVYNFYREPDAADKLELYRRSIQGSAMLGIPWTVFHPSMIPDKDRETMHADNRRFFAPLVELGEKLGVGLAMENMASARFGMDTAEELAAFIDAFGSKAVGACWDTGHAHLAGQNQPESLRTLGKRLHALHIQDNFAVNDDHMAPHFGSIDWPPILQTLREMDYPHDFTFEAHMIVRRVPEGAKADAARLLYRIGMELTGEAV